MYANRCVRNDKKKTVELASNVVRIHIITEKVEKEKERERKRERESERERE